MIKKSGNYFGKWFSKLMNNTKFAKYIKNLRKNGHLKPVTTKMYCIMYVLHLAICSYHVTYTFQSTSTLYTFLNVKELSARRKLDIWNLSDCSGTRINNHLVHKRTRNHLANRPKDWAVLWVFIRTVHLTVYSYHVTYTFQSESTLYDCLNVNKLIARNRRGLSDGKVTRTHSHLVRKLTLKDLAKLAKWLICVVSTYMYGALDCIFLSCNVRILEWIHTL